MRVKDYKCKCGHNDFFFADKGNQKGIYCSYCGKWLKWADKDEQNLTLKQEPQTDMWSIKDVADTLAKHGLIREQEPKTGHWIKTISENGITSSVRCSECGFEDNRYMLFRYCPNCGAKMESGEI